MPCSVRVEVRSPWLLWRAAPTVLTLALFSVACPHQDTRTGSSAESSAGSPEIAGESAAGAGGQGAQRSQSGGAEGNLGGAGGDAAHPAADTETEPEVADPEVVEPEVVEPEIVDPEVVEPRRDEHGDGALNLPCDVAKLLRTRCTSCHSSPPSGGASVALITYADLTAPSQVDPSITLAERSLQRMNDSLVPMPPAPASPATREEIAGLQVWLEEGLPPAACDDDPRSPSTNPYDAAPTCTSGSYWAAIDSGTPWMNPGLPCIKCHRQYPSFAPLFTVAGTVFPTAHEPDKCFGVPAAAGVEVIITDANGQQLSPIRVVSGGNFGAILSGLPLPYRAKVVVGNTERVMLTPQTNGDCNACHTQAGAQGAMGRIIVP